MKLNVTKASIVLEQDSNDKIFLHTEYDSPIENSIITKHLVTMFTATEGTGEKYLKQVLKLNEIEIININEKMVA